MPCLPRETQDENQTPRPLFLFAVSRTNNRRSAPRGALAFVPRFGNPSNLLRHGTREGKLASVLSTPFSSGLKQNVHDLFFLTNFAVTNVRDRGVLRGYPGAAHPPMNGRRSVSCYGVLRARCFRRRLSVNWRGAYRRRRRFCPEEKRRKTVVGMREENAIRIKIRSRMVQFRS